MALAWLTDSTAGSISINGVDADSIHLETLRRCISWVPQEPSFFSGTLRFNLDPFSQYSDEQIWEALRNVRMADAFGEDVESEDS